MAVEVPVRVSINGVSDVKNGLNQITESFNLSKLAVEKMVGAFAGAAVIAKTVQFLKEAHDAAQENRTSITLLTQSMGFYSSALDDQAESMSKSLFIGKNEILQADQRLLIYTREESSIKKLIPGIADLAKIKGTDLVTAANNQFLY